MAAVYLETSFISACVTTRTSIRALYERETSLEWLATEGLKHKLFCSDAVIGELSAPTYPQSQEALTLAVRFLSMNITPDMEALALKLAERFVMPQDLSGDALHVAAATIARMEYLLTWNVLHLANEKKEHHLRVVCAEYNLVPPKILRPDAFI